MYEVTLVGPKTTMTATTDNRDSFKEFVLWLNRLGYLNKKVKNGKYNLDFDNQVKACRIKARKLGLTA